MDTYSYSRFISDLNSSQRVESTHSFWLNKLKRKKLIVGLTREKWLMTNSGIHKNQSAKQKNSWHFYHAKIISDTSGKFLSQNLISKKKKEADEYKVQNEDMCRTFPSDKH